MDLIKQYDRFIAQLRVEVDQMFWFNNFFFAIDSTLLGIVFFREDINKINLVILILAGFILSIYWLIIMIWKNDWRKSWLCRIRKIEEDSKSEIPEELWMFPERVGPKSGLWNFLFLLPCVFVVAWFLIVIPNLLK